MAIPTIMFSVQIGSEGFAIASSVAHQLGYRYYDWEITALARNLTEGGLSRENDSSEADRMINEVLAAAVFDQEVPPALLAAPSQLKEQTARVHAIEKDRDRVAEVVWNLALEGSAVIIGHGAQATLMGQPHVLSILIVSPLATRAEGLATAQDTTVAEARQLLAELDDLKRSFLKRTYGLRWLDVSNYDIVINSGFMPPETAVAMILAAASLEKLPVVEMKPTERNIDTEGSIDERSHRVDSQAT